MGKTHSCDRILAFGNRPTSCQQIHDEGKTLELLLLFLSTSFRLEMNNPSFKFNRIFLAIGKESTSLGAQNRAVVNSLVTLHIQIQIQTSGCLRKFSNKGGNILL